MTLLVATGQLAHVAAREPKCYSRSVNEWICGDYVKDRSDELAEATLTHLEITVAAVVFGLVLAVPLALLARRYLRLESAVLGFSTFLYTVPSLALLPLLVPLTGLTKTTVVVGLGLYCLTILVRALLDGLRSVPDDVKESATGLGYGAGRLLWRIELPLALPVVMAGLRVATVSTVALTTVGVITGNGGLGQLIIGGFNANFYRAEIVTGALGCVVLALVADLLLAGAQRLLTPWTRGTAA